MADLITLNEFLAVVGKNMADLESSEIAAYQSAISYASDAVREYCDRELALNADSVQGTRDFRYYGYGVLEIDDCTAVNQISTTPTGWAPFSRVLQAPEWIAGPPEKAVKNYVELWTTIPYPDSPQMGFQWNADMYAPIARPILFTVNAVWGWPEIPGSVKSATALIANEMALAEAPYIAESIEGYSHTFGSSRSASTQPQGAIPVRAQSLLEPYIRVNI